MVARRIELYFPVFEGAAGPPSKDSKILLLKAITPSVKIDSPAEGKQDDVLFKPSSHGSSKTALSVKPEKLVFSGF